MVSNPVAQIQPEHGNAPAKASGPKLDCPCIETSSAILSDSGTPCSVRAWFSNTTSRRHKTQVAGSPSGYMRLLLILHLDRHYVICAGALLALAHFELDRLAVVQRRVVVTAFDFRMVHEKILSPIFRCDETITLSGIKPLNCSFTHFLVLDTNGENINNSDFEFTFSKQKW